MCSYSLEKLESSEHLLRFRQTDPTLQASVMLSQRRISPIHQYHKIAAFYRYIQPCMCHRIRSHRQRFWQERPDSMQLSPCVDVFKACRLRARSPKKSRCCFRPNWPARFHRAPPFLSTLKHLRQMFHCHREVMGCTTRHLLFGVLSFNPILG